MAEITITKQLSDLQSVFDKVKRVFFSSDVNLDFSSLADLDMELPVLEDSFSYDSGAVSITPVKLTTGAKWAGYVTAGDAAITMQIASVAGAVNDLLLNKKGSAIAAGTNTLDGKTLSGQGYSTAPKKVLGSLVCASEDGTQLFALPSVEMYANFISQGGTPAYYNVQVNPKANADGADIIFLTGASA